MERILENLNGSAGQANSRRPIPASNVLTQEIRRIAVDGNVPVFDRRRYIADLVEMELKTKGIFWTNGGRLFYFLDTERHLLDMQQQPFVKFLQRLTGLMRSEPLLRFVLNRLRTEAEQAKEIEVRLLSYYDPKTHLLVVSDGGPGVWRRELGGEWKYALNGENGIFFLTDINADRWQPEFRPSKYFVDLNWFVEEFPFASSISRLSREDQFSLLRLVLLYSFFPALCGSRMIPAFFGGPGSGRTTALRLMGRLLVGRRFEVSDVRTDKLAFFDAASSRIVLALDNADSKSWGFKDVLSRYASGARFEVARRNELVPYESSAILIFSSREPLTGPAVAESLVPFFCARPTRCLPDGEIFGELGRRRGAVMGDLLRHIGLYADRLAVTEPQAVPYRNADFASFALRVCPEDCSGNGTWLGLLGELQQAQGHLISYEDDIISALRILFLNGGKIGPVTTAELYRRCSVVAQENSWILPKNVQGFGQRLNHLRQVIERELNARFRELPAHANKRLIAITAADKN